MLWHFQILLKPFHAPCMPHAQPMSSLCSANVQPMLSQCPAYAQPMSSLCSANVQPMLSQCPPAYVLSQCPPAYAQPMSSLCSANVQPMLSQCPALPKMTSQCLANASASPANAQPASKGASQPLAIRFYAVTRESVPASKKFALKSR